MFKTTMTRLIGSTGLTVKKFSPELYLVGAVGAGIASTVMLAKAHKNSDEVFEDDLENLVTVREYIAEQNAAWDAADEAVQRTMVRVSKADEQKALLPTYMSLLKSATILYGPAVLMGVSAIALVMASHGTLKNRNRALLSALTLFERGFATYRQRVIDEIGEEADERFYYGAESRKITTLEKDKEGKTKKKKETKNHIPENPTPMIYSRTFDEANQNWSVDPDMSEYFLRAVQTQMNDTLYIQGYIMLNTVYKSLGFLESPEGAVVGWSNKVPGDDYVSFGLENDINQRPGDNRWILDFNVNGVVYETIGEK